MDVYEYLALAIDLEGFISISRTEYCNKYYYNPKVRVCNTSLKILYSIRDKTKIGNVDPTPRLQENANYNYFWALYNHEIKEHMPKIKEYLVIKHEQCQNVIELLNMKRSSRDRKGKSTQYHTKETFDRMEELYQINKELNSRVFRPISPEEEFLRQLRLYTR